MDARDRVFADVHPEQRIVESVIVLAADIDLGKLAAALILHEQEAVAAFGRRPRPDRRLKRRELHAMGAVVSPLPCRRRAPM